MCLTCLMWLTRLIVLYVTDVTDGSVFFSCLFCLTRLICLVYLTCLM